MGKTPIKLNEHFAVATDENGIKNEVIYYPPLLAESQNIRIELRKEKNHARAHVHIIKKGRNHSYDVSIALDDLTLLAGTENLKHFARNEYQAILEFIIENQDRFKKIYEVLRGDL
jgi:hypothetical protein